MRSPLSIALVTSLASGLSACGACGDEPRLDIILKQVDADFLALRRSSPAGDSGTHRFRNRTLQAAGEPCATASDKETCLAGVADAWPRNEAGWERDCWFSGCDRQALVATKGDTVVMATDAASIMEVFGEVDSVEKAVFLARGPHGYYAKRCWRVKEVDGGYEMKGNITTSDCPTTEEKHRILIKPDGALKKLDTLKKEKTNSCAGRRPDGLASTSPAGRDEVGRHLADVARLEAASVIAFERLAAELAAWRAPEALVRRAEQAAADEVRHAARMQALAEARGARPSAVEVAPSAPRSLVAFAIENAVEGCVRETYGVVDAAFRAHRAPTAELRAVYAEIAADEARHAGLAWDVAAWLQGRLTPPERAAVQEAMGAAQDELERALSEPCHPSLAEQLGAPNDTEAVAMARALRRQLAA